MLAELDMLEGEMDMGAMDAGGAVSITLMPLTSNLKRQCAGAKLGATGSRPTDGSASWCHRHPAHMVLRVCDTGCTAGLNQFGLPDAPNGPVPALQQPALQ